MTRITDSELEHEFIEAKDIDGYTTVAHAMCYEAGEMVLLCNDSTHYILCWRMDPRENAVKVKSFYYGAAEEEESNAVYRKALEEMVMEASLR